MPAPRKRVKKEARDARGAGKGDEVEVEGEGEGVGEGREDVPENVERRGPGLKHYMEEIQSGRHRVIEMRLAMVCGLGVGTRVLFLEELENELLANSTFTYLAICILILVLSTWLGYFPSKLEDVELRQAEGQGMALACLLPGMVCIAVAYSALYSAPQIIGLLSLYLCVLCSMSLCSILATLFHTIPFPNSITVYNLTAIGLSLVVQAWFNVPFWVVLVSIALYSVAVPWLLYSFPRSFTLGEAMLVAQGLSLLLVDTGLQLVAMYDLITLPSEWKIVRSESILYLELLWTGVFFCCLLLSPALYKVTVAKYHHERKFWSGTFILLSLSVGLMLILQWLATLLGGYNAIGFVFIYMFDRHIRLVLVVYWLMVTVAAGILVAAQSTNSVWLSPLKSSQPSSLWMRKWFHLLALLVFLPGVALDPPFLAFAASLLSFLFLVAELARFFRLWPIGDFLFDALQPMADSRDAGPLLLTHLYLLLGFSLPLWLFPHRDYSQMTKLAMYSGVLSLGIGDSVAAVAGRLMGKTKWPGTKKTVEGSLMSVMTQLLGVLLIIIIDPNISFLALRQWVVVLGSLVVTAAMEAYTWQIDNLVLSQFQFSFLLAFL